MKIRLWPVCCLPLVFALGTSACNGGGAGASPTAPTRPTTTETFSGTLAVGAIVIHAFPVSGAGTVRMIVTSLSPASTMQIGLGFGVWDDVNCALALVTNQARANQLFEASVAVAANYCVSLGDAGNFTDTTTYTIRVEHP